LCVANPHCAADTHFGIGTRPQNYAEDYRLGAGPRFCSSPASSRRGRFGLERSGVARPKICASGSLRSEHAMRPVGNGRTASAKLIDLAGPGRDLLRRAQREGRTPFRIAERLIASAFAGACAVPLRRAVAISRDLRTSPRLWLARWRAAVPARMLPESNDLPQRREASNEVETVS
jgi:hypothetical protein